MSQLSKKNILVILTGSIACYKACSVISKLKQTGHAVKVVLSPSSLEFIGKATIEGLTGEPPIDDMYAPGKVMDHIFLNRWADLILVAPATANYINKIANGIGDDLLTTLFLSHGFEKPFLVAPAMNTKMYLHPITQSSINKLKSLNVQILETASGVLACGEIGSGKLLDPELILAEIDKNLDYSVRNFSASESGLQPKKMRVLITGGGTSEPIDDVRVITNRSTGRTASFLANALSESGIDVTYLHSTHALKANSACQHYSFDSFKDLQQLIEGQLKKNSFDCIVHAAAVSDYSLQKHIGKLDSSAEELHLTLKKNPKIIEQIQILSPSSKLYAFKLTSNLNENQIREKVSSLFTTTGCVRVIQNDWLDVAEKNNCYRVFSKDMNFKQIDSMQNLGAFLFQEMVTGEFL